MLNVWLLLVDPGVSYTHDITMRTIIINTDQENSAFVIHCLILQQEPFNDKIKSFSASAQILTVVVMNVSF